MKVTILKLIGLGSLYFNNMFSSFGLLMQFPEPPDGDEDPMPPVAPIDDHIFVACIAALLFGVYYLIRIKNAEKSNSV